MYLSALVSEKLSCIVNDLFVGHVTVRLLLTHTEHLPQRHAKCPNVTRRRELALHTGQQYYAHD